MHTAKSVVAVRMSRAGAFATDAVGNAAVAVGDAAVAVGRSVESFCSDVRIGTDGSMQHDDPAARLC
jgi:hypothetical protein